MNNKPYVAPRIQDFGGVAETTGVFGDQSRADIFVGPSGEVVQIGLGSIDACATADQARCITGPA